MSGVLLSSSWTGAWNGSALAGSPTPDRSGQAAAQFKSGASNTGLEILSDTRGVDFNPYLKGILRTIYNKWLPFIPEKARPPQNAGGETVIRFAIAKDGTLKAMHLDGSTHDDAMNRAAWGAITGVEKFPPLPEAFTGPELELRVRFLVNMKPDGKR